MKTSFKEAGPAARRGAMGPAPRQDDPFKPAQAGAAQPAGQIQAIGVRRRSPRRATAGAITPVSIDGPARRTVNQINR